MSLGEVDRQEIENLIWFKERIKAQRKLYNKLNKEEQHKHWLRCWRGEEDMFFEDDICWCADSKKCDNTSCFRHTNNRRTTGVFTSGHLMDTELCENNKESKMERTVRVWIGNDYVDVDITVREEWNEDEIYEAAVLYVYDVISVEVL